MSILSAQRDRLRKVAGELQSIIDGLNKSHITYDGLMDTLNYSILCLNDAADTIWQLRNDCVDLRDENAKLRELVRDMFEEIEDACFDPLVERQGKRGPYYEEDPSWRVGIRERVRELGIEADW